MRRRMPVRKIPKNYRYSTGIVNRGAERSGAFEGTYERDLLLLCRYDWRIKRVEAQPVRIQYRDFQGVDRSYVPDLLIEYHPGTGLRPHLCEVKPKAYILKHIVEYQDRFKAAAAFARRNGWLFKVRHEKHIRTPQLKAAEHIDRMRVFKANDFEMQWLRNTLRDHGRCTLGGFVAVLEGQKARDDLERIFWASLAKQKIVCDMLGRPGLHTEIWVP